MTPQAMAQSEKLIPDGGYRAAPAAVLAPSHPPLRPLATAF
jgi:hypothetical protein